MIAKRKPTHPGVVFYEDYVLYTKIVTLGDIKSCLKLNSTDLLKFFQGEFSCSTLLSKRIARLTGTTWESWCDMQKNYDIWIEENEK